MNWMTRTIHAFVRVPVLAFALCTGAVALASAAPAFAAPAIDGNIDDMVAFAQSLSSSGAGCGLYITDKPDANGNPTPETIYNDLKFIPCPQPQPALGTHWVNGVEIFRHVLAYEAGSTTLYLGLRSEGFIGDGDGNGNPDNAGGGSCNPNDNIEDTLGISGNELYAWSFDLNCDGSTDGTIKVQDNVVTGTGTLAGATGTLAFRQGGSATGHDLELQVTLPAPLPAAFRFLRVEANAFDGLSEDRSDGAVCIGNPNIAVQKTAVPTAVCVGQNTRFTVTVQNTGQTPLSVVVVDQLPAQLAYAANPNLSSSCGVGAPVVNGQLLTFPAFNLAAGANCTISFDVTASAQCAGVQNNIVDVTGTFTSACIKETGSISKTAHAEFAVTCAKDGYALLRAVYDKASPTWLAELPAVETLRQVLVQNYTLVIHANGREVVKRREKKQPEGDGIPPGRYRIASPYDTDARWGAKRDESWLGYKLHVTETCDDAPSCGCGGPGHDGDCDAAAFPNLVTFAATTSAAATDMEMTGVIDDALAAKGLAPGRHYLDCGYLSAGRLVAEAARHGIALIGPRQADTSAQAGNCPPNTTARSAPIASSPQAK